MNPPQLTDGRPSPGTRVCVTTPKYAGTDVHHSLYLPVDWTPGNQYPVLVEFPPNRWNESSGEVADCRLGYDVSDGGGFLWIALPFVNSTHTRNQTQWWGDEDATAEYCKLNIPRICAEFGGDPSAIFLMGFSRGAIACSYIGLRDDAIARLWAGFMPHSHMDGPPFTERGHIERLASRWPSALHHVRKRRRWQGRESARGGDVKAPRLPS